MAVLETLAAPGQAANGVLVSHGIAKVVLQQQNSRMRATSSGCSTTGGAAGKKMGIYLPWRRSARSSLAFLVCLVICDERSKLLGNVLGEHRAHHGLSISLGGRRPEEQVGFFGCRGLNFLIPPCVVFFVPLQCFVGRTPRVGLLLAAGPAQQYLVDPIDHTC